MPRTLVLGNGKLQVSFDSTYGMRDLFFPKVGLENHLAGGLNRAGIWANGEFAWFHDPVWERTLGYQDIALVTDVRLYHPQWKLEVVFNDAVDLDRSLFLRRATVTNHGERPQQVRLFFHYDFHIYGVKVGDTIYYSPTLQALIAYKGKRYFLANVQNGNGPGIDDWATGVSQFQGKEGTWRDAEDGVLQQDPVAQGSVDATVCLSLDTVAPEGYSEGYHWLAVGESKAEVEELDSMVRERTPATFIDRTRDWWRAWGRKEQTDFADLGPETVGLYKRSLLTIRTHVDNGGAIIASTDWDIEPYSRDTYAYCWPRDASLVAMAMDSSGYGELTRRYFEFCFQVLDPFQGYFLQKYGAGGDVASSWHPWIGEGQEPQIPFQEDETGLVLMALWHHYQQYRDIEFVKPLYRPLVRGTADFMAAYHDAATGLPNPSYDLWEERRGVHAFTIASVWAGLEAAANFAHAFNQQSIGDGYRQAAEGIRQAALDHLWDAELGHFSRTLHPRPDGLYDRDSTLDSSTLALSLYGMLPPDDPRMQATAEAIHRRLWCQTGVGGLARYENDPYQRVSEDIENTPGNPWIICTLWLAQYFISRAKSRSDLDKARPLLQWAEQYALGSGLMPEQLHPYTGEPMSVCPLTWSHGEFVTTIHRYLAAYRTLA